MSTYRVVLVDDHGIPDATGPFWYWGGDNMKKVLQDISFYFHRATDEFCIIEADSYFVLKDGVLHEKKVRSKNV